MHDLAVPDFAHEGGAHGYECDDGIAQGDVGYKRGVRTPHKMSE